jgi:hypothetical protein
MDRIYGICMDVDIFNRQDVDIANQVFYHATVGEKLLFTPLRGPE